jgi:molybdopterin converting factor subunit 1
MNVEVRFFASLREAAGTDVLRLGLPEGAGFDALMRALKERLQPAALAALEAENVLLAHNQDLVAPPFPLSDGDEVAFLPPVTGG